MQALLVLYMATHLLQPGAVEAVVGFAALRGAIEAVFGSLSVQALATQIFGLYVGLIYFMPVLGGYLGDRLMGRRRADRRQMDAPVRCVDRRQACATLR